MLKSGEETITICVCLNTVNRGRGGRFSTAPGSGICTAVMGNVKKPVCHQGKVNLREYQKLPPASGVDCLGPRWRCSLETLKTRLNKSLENIERDSLGNMEWDMVLFLQSERL